MNEKYIKLRTFIIIIIVLVLIFILSTVLIISYYKDRNITVNLPTEVEQEDDDIMENITLTEN